jgi:HNH endonuclease/AP2 domain
MAALEKLRELFSYDPEKGSFRWNGEAGYISGNGYRYISVEGKKRLSHRLAWLMHYGEEPNGLVDHINGDRTDNRIQNLRLATYSQNSANAKLHTRNTSGLKGASWMPKKNRWQATITVKNKQMNLGYFKTKEAAHDAYMAAAKKYHGEFANDGLSSVCASLPKNRDWLYVATPGFGA